MSLPGEPNRIEVWPVEEPQRELEPVEPEVVPQEPEKVPA